MSEYENKSEVATQPLNGIAFQLYLKRHNISPLDAALAVGVRYLTVWRMTRALPVRREDEMIVRQGLFRLTGEWYTAPIPARSESAPSLRHRKVRLNRRV
jgi:hypothetical protein